MSATPPAVDAATATMISLIGSLADNKSALGRRYGEWAVSAPTIESAVAAAAMAQDELGHARSTYPVLAKLGVEREDEGLDAGTPMPVIARELPDWASFIAANLVVDGILTTFVATARDSSIEPLAQRARKILQEEGAHRVHAEAWAAADLPGRRSRPGAVARSGSRRCGSQAARWPGPDDDPGYREAIARRMVSEGPAAIRDRVRRVARRAARRGRLRRGARRAGATGRRGIRSAANERHPARLPVLRLARRRAGVRLGRTADHQPDALPRLQHLLRGDREDRLMDEQLRRRSVGAPAARSLLLTVLGEYVLPRPERRVAGDARRRAGVARLHQQAARQALSRSTRDGWLESRAPRPPHAHDADASRTAELLRSGAAADLLVRRPWEWDGRWLVLVLRVPEERREVRHQLRSRLAWAGLGSLGGGVWLTPARRARGRAGGRDQR